jgi:hypothetical protein
MNDTRTATALALWLLVLAPQWALLLWGMRRLTGLRQAVAQSFWLKLLAVGCWVGSTLLAMFGTVWVWRDLLGPERPGVQRVVHNGTLVDQGLIIAVAVLLVWRRTRTGEAG